MNKHCSKIDVATDLSDVQNLNTKFMNYSLKKISTVEACDSLLASAQKMKENLERRRRNLGELINKFNERISSICDELISVQVLLETYATAYNILPQGSKYKVNINIKVKRLEVRKARLEKMSITYNAHSLLRKQIVYNRLDTRVSAINSYIAAVQRRKAALANTLLYYGKQKLLKSIISGSIKIPAEKCAQISTAFYQTSFETVDGLMGRLCQSRTAVFSKLAKEESVLPRYYLRNVLF